MAARVQSASTEMGLQINASKTAVTSLNTSAVPTVSIYGEQMPVVKSFKYLAVILSSESTGSDMFQTRLNQGFAKLAVLKPVLQCSARTSLRDLRSSSFRLSFFQ